MVISGQNTGKWYHVNSAFMCFVYLFTKKFLTEFIEKFVQKLSKYFFRKIAHLCVVLFYDACIYFLI